MFCVQEEVREEGEGGEGGEKERQGGRGGECEEQIESGEPDSAQEGRRTEL